MAIYSYSDALPIAGVSGALITAAIATDGGLTASELAREADVSKWAAGRVLPDLVDQQFLIRDRFGRYKFNTDHQMAPLLEDLTYRISGAQPPTPNTIGLNVVERSRLQELDRTLTGSDGNIPAGLLAGDIDAFAEVPDGPSVFQARQTCVWIARLMPRLCQPQNLTQDAYSTWHTERQRDLIHVTVHLGAAAATAHSLLTKATRHPHADSPQQPISGRAWLQATYLLHSEALALLDITHRMRESVKAGTTMARHYQLAREPLAVYPDQAGDHLPQAVDHNREGDAIWDASRRHGLHHIGGLPDPDSFGRTGDELLAVLAHHLAVAITTQVDQMAQHPSVQTWLTTHPDLAERFPLTVPTDELELRPAPR